MLALQNGLVGNPGTDLHDAGRLHHDVHRRRPDDVHGILRHGGAAGTSVCALYRIPPSFPKRAKGAFEVQVGGGHHLHAGYAADLRDQALAHLAYADEADADGGPLPLEVL